MMRRNMAGAAGKNGNGREAVRRGAAFMCMTGLEQLAAAHKREKAGNTKYVQEARMRQKSLHTRAIIAFLRLPNKPRTGPEIMGRYSGTGDKADLDNHSSQLNPNNERYAGDEED